MTSDAATPEEPGPVRGGSVRWRRLRRRLLVAAGALALVALGALLHGLTDVNRGRPVREVVGAGPGEAPLRISDPRFLELAGALTGTSLEPGHEVEIVTDTMVFHRMLADIAAARRSVMVQDYFCKPGLLGGRLADVLAERARAGVRVLLLGDGFSCVRYLHAVEDRLRAAGAHVAVLRPIHWWALNRAQHRSHVRIVVVDGAVAYTGGFGIADKWMGGASGQPPWRDTNVRFRGPAVLRAEAAFLDGWAEATGTLRTEPEEPAAARGAASRTSPDEATEPPEPAAAAPSSDDATEPEAVDSVVAGFLVSEPGLGTTAAERYLALTVAGAEKSLYMANSYFVPTPLLRRQLARAARRGVDVRLLLPGPRTDMPSTRYAGRAFYDSLLVAGVRIWEYRPTMMHAKTIVADGVWGSVGGINLDNRSIRLNSEAALLFYDRRVGARLDSLFRVDLSEADEITLEQHRRRPWWDRVREQVVRLVAPFL